MRRILVSVGLAVMLLGLAAHLKGYSRHFQANTIRDRRVLSVFTVGILVLEEIERRRQFA